MNIFEREPALIIGSTGAVVGALITLGVAFGLPVTPAEIGAVSAFFVVLTGVAAAFVTRSKVSPVAMLPKPLPLDTLPASPPTVVS